MHGKIVCVNKPDSASPDARNRARTYVAVRAYMFAPQVWPLQARLIENASIQRVRVGLILGTPIVAAYDSYADLRSLGKWQGAGWS